MTTEREKRLQKLKNKIRYNMRVAQEAKREKESRAPGTYCANRVNDVAKFLGSSSQYLNGLSDRPDLMHTPYNMIKRFSKNLGIPVETVAFMSGKEVILKADGILLQHKYFNRNGVETEQTEAEAN